MYYNLDKELDYMITLEKLHLSERTLQLFKNSNYVILNDLID
ncbi:MAG: hypothetical protein K0R54_3979 [Clostridiaceae bacterium]|jgi:hypothetical protein|nr:hypothetical protein [Clostridiaceae bacterium]